MGSANEMPIWFSSLVRGAILLYPPSNRAMFVVQQAEAVAMKSEDRAYWALATLAGVIFVMVVLNYLWALMEPGR